MSAPAPLRHYYAAPEVDNPDHDHARFPAGVCARRGCARPPSDPVHLAPGDNAAFAAAIEAATAHVPHEELDTERAPAVRARRRARGPSVGG